MPHLDGIPQVLVVDDEEVVRLGIAQVLSRQNLDVRTTADGSEALELMAGSVPAVVLLDVKMPGLDGKEVLKFIRRDYPTAHVIMITGYPDIEGAVECMKLGAKDYLVKPFRIDELEALVTKALDSHNQGPACVLSSDEEYADQGIASIIGSSPTMQKVFAKIRRAAPSDSKIGRASCRERV